MMWLYISVLSVLSTRSFKSFNFAAIMGNEHCEQCARIVTSRQHAIACDNCGRWVHRICGTGKYTVN